MQFRDCNRSIQDHMPLIRFSQYNVRPDETSNPSSPRKRECYRLLTQDNVRPDEPTNLSSYIKENDPDCSHSITCPQTRRPISAHNKNRIAPDCSHSITCPQTRRLISARNKKRIVPACSDSIMRPDESTNLGSHQKDTYPDRSHSITCSAPR